MRIGKLALVLLIVMAVLTQHSSAAEPPPQTFLRVMARVNAAGYTDLAIHKTYLGESGPIDDVISLYQEPDGYPKVEVRTTGPIEAEVRQGGVVIKSTGPGRASIDLFITHNRPWTDWLLQMPDTPGVGVTKTNVSVVAASGFRAVEAESGLVLYSKHGSSRVFEKPFSGVWTTNTDVPESEGIHLKLAFQPIPMAPLWIAQTALAVALLSLLCSGYLLLRNRRRPETPNISG